MWIKFLPYAMVVMITSYGVWKFNDMTRTIDNQQVTIAVITSNAKESEVQAKADKIRAVVEAKASVRKEYLEKTLLRD